MEENLLDGCRVLDLTGEKGLFCGKILGDMGADVIKIEKPEGDPARNIGPFYKDVIHPEKSLFWMAYNVNKRGITLNLEMVDGREIFKNLVKTSDFVVESFDPGYMDSLGLGYPELEKINPRVIMVSISPFGQNGPYKDFKGADIVDWAMSGVMYSTGDMDRPPVRVSVPQAYLLAGMHAATGGMIAYYHRELTGEGQHVDVSIQQSCSLSLMISVEIYDMLKVVAPRTGNAYIVGRPGPLGPLALRWLYPCKDGHILLFLMAGSVEGYVRSCSALVQWANSEGMCMDLKDYNWRKHDATTLTQDERNRVEKSVTEFLLTKTKKELLDEAVKRDILLGPVCNVKDLLESPQYASRNFWTSFHYPGLGDDIIYPGQAAQTSEINWKLNRPAPLIGEHNDEVYHQCMGFSKEKICMLKTAGII